MRLLLIIYYLINSSLAISEEVYDKEDAATYILKALAAYPAINQLYNTFERKIPLNNRTKTTLGILGSGTITRRVDTGRLIKSNWKGWRIEPEFEYDIDTQEAKIKVAFSIKF